MKAHLPAAAVHPVWSIPLDGPALIEASAGTGKTWTICGLYLRLLLEARLAPREILTVTFTNAATAELKSRIRSRLLGLRSMLGGPGTASDGAGDDLLHFSRQVPDRRTLEAAVENALAGMDEAAITTIHGFCQNVLADHAFELGLPFGMQVLEEEEPLLLEAAADVWRREIAPADGLWMAYLRGRAADPAALLRQLEVLRHASGATVLRPAGENAGDERMLASAYAAARATWQRDRRHALDAMRASAGGGRRASDWAERIDRYFDAEVPSMELPRTSSVDLFARLQQLGTAASGPLRSLAEAVARFAAAVTALQSHFAWRYADLLVRCAERLDGAVQSAKRVEARVSYDDLITRVRLGLEGAGGDRLAAQLQEAYKAALIDEFQDTDRHQYAIFARLFGAGRPLFLVGDPKQSVYRFRGADIHAYLRARLDAKRQYPLLENRRSTAGLVQAVNHLFARHDQPFMTPRIGFARVTARSAVSLRGREASRPPLQWWWLSGEDKLTKLQAVERAVHWTGHEVARLLNESARGHAQLLEPGRHARALSGSDIAVLTGTHRESELVRAALNRRGIACTTQSSQSVFASEEAADLAVWVRAVARPGDPRRLKAALATRLLGESARDIAELDRDAARWDARVDEFDRYARLARSGHWLASWQAMLTKRRVASRYMALDDGARRLTNLRHLAELCDAHMANDALSLDGLAALLLRGASETTTEERELRLESDEPLVHVMTMHSAKGLEFPIVFCPFLWNVRGGSSGGSRSGLPVCHDGEANLLVDLGSGALAEHAELEQHEIMEESVRLAYVALTRAQVRCYVAAGLVNRCENAPLTWLLHGADCAPGPQALNELKDRYVASRAALLRAQLDEVAAGSGGSMEVKDAFTGDATAMLPFGTPVEGPPHARRFTRTLRARTIASFSSLAAAEDPELPDYDQRITAAEDPELPDYDQRITAGDDAEPPDHDPSSPRSGAAERRLQDLSAGESFPRGARAGSCLHALFERLAPAAIASMNRFDEAAQIGTTIVAALREHGLAPSHAEAAFVLLRNTLLTRLSPAVPPLAEIAAGRRLTELAFHARITASQPLQRLLAAYRRTLSPDEGAPPGTLLLPAGYLKGYIDLVFEHDGRFYIVDYKSNSLPSYDMATLGRVVRDELYDLQYLLYASALMQYLRRRLPSVDFEHCFGGVFYLFLRGMHPGAGPGRGVYFARPGREALDRLAALTVPEGVST